MAGFDYSKAKATADRLIAKFGQPAVLQRPTSAGGTAHNPIPGSPLRYPCTVVVIDFTDVEITDGGGRIFASDKKVLLAKGNLAIAPKPSDKLELGGVVHQIVGPEGRGIKTVSPGGVTVLWELQCRR